MDLTETIVIIASHSGGTFASLAVSNLLQAFTKKIFVITSEFDTQASIAPCSMKKQTPIRNRN